MKVAQRAVVAGALSLTCACSGAGQSEDRRDGSGGVASTTGGGGANASGSTASGGTVQPGSAGAGVGGFTASAGTGGSAGAGAPMLTLTSPALENITGCSVETPTACDVFPDENVSYHENANVSPELRWTGVPPGTQSFALVLFDVTFGQAHWALWNIPADTTMLAANVPKDTATPSIPVGSRQANANFATAGGDGYFGPHVPCNVFEFQLYALSSTFSPKDLESSVLVAIELQEPSAPVLAVARLAGRVNDSTKACE